MVNDYTTSLDKVFSALADPTRRAIVERLTKGEKSVSDLALPFSSSLPAISKHLGILEDAGLILRRNMGRQRICSLAPAAFSSASKWIEFYSNFWNGQLDALDAYLQAEAAQATTVSAE